MRKIDLEDYTVNEVTFQMRTSLAAVLFNEEGLDPREVIRRDELANKIEQQSENLLFLEESEWNKIVSGLKATDLKPHGRSVVEFIRRVLDAPEVEVQEKRQ